MKIRIVDSMSEYNKELMYKIKHDLIDEPITGMVMTAKTFAQVFTPERIRLLKRIHKNNIKNIYQLAKELDKPYEVVFRNIKYFEGLGLIKISSKGRSKIPCLEEKPVIEIV